MTWEIAINGKINSYDFMTGEIGPGCVQFSFNSALRVSQLIKARCPDKTIQLIGAMQVLSV